MEVEHVKLEQQNEIKMLQKILLQGEKIHKKEYAEKLKLEYKVVSCFCWKLTLQEFKDKQKELSKQQKGILKSDKSTPTNQKKMVAKQQAEDLEFNELRFVHSQQLSKLKEDHKQQFENLGMYFERMKFNVTEKHLLKQQYQMTTRHKLQEDHLKKENQLRSDSQLLFQEMISMK